MENIVIRLCLRKTQRTMRVDLVEKRMAFKALHSVELLVRAMRDTGPFGGSSIDSINIGLISRRAEEEVDRALRKQPSETSMQNRCKVVKVFLEDKFEKSNKILVEEVTIEALQIPENLNGFEYLCHPYLEKEENLVKYFKSWHSTTLMSLFHLLENSALCVYFLNPGSPEERDVANDLRRKYNLVAESSEVEHTKLSSESIRQDSSLDILIKTRHYIKNVLIKLKVANLRNYSQIIEDLRALKKEAITSSARRNRFFSEEIPDHAIMSRKLYVQEMSGPAGKASNEDSNVNSSELSTSFRSNSRPFRLQESLLEERAENSKRRMMSGGEHSFSRLMRKGRVYSYRQHSRR